MLKSALSKVFNNSNSLKNFIRLSSTKLDSIEKKISILDVNINYVQSGKGSKAVLLMPGALGSAWTDFKPQIESLPKFLPNHVLIAWDPPGYGKSIPPRRNFTLDFFNRDAMYAWNLMNELGWSKFSVVGWSDGGITGIILAGTYPESVEKLIFWGTGAYIIENETKVFESIRDVSKWSQKMREPMEKMYGTDEFAKLWSEWVDVMLAIYKHKNGNLCKEEVEKIKAQTLIIHGKKDPMIAAEHIPYLKERIKGVRYFEFPEGKHNVHLRYSDEFDKIVADFLMK